MIHTILVTDGFCENLKKHIQAAADDKIVACGAVDSLAGIRIEVVEDPAERKSQAMELSLTTGQKVWFEGEEGKIMSVMMPTPRPKGHFGPLVKQDQPKGNSE